MSWFFLCLAAGVGALLVGLIGFGSSLVILPVALLIFPTLFDPQIAVRLAVGTTMATMVFGALSAGYAQSRDANVCWPLLRLMLLPYLIGALLGPWLSKYVAVDWLRYYIVAVLVLAGIQMLRVSRPGGKKHFWESSRPQIVLVHLVIGLAGSVAGIASGLFAIPYLSRFELPLRSVIATSTVAAALYSSFATVGYVSAGWNDAALPPWSAGYVYLPAFAAMGVSGVVCGLLGVRVARSVPEFGLRRLLAGFVLTAALAILLR